MIFVVDPALVRGCEKSIQRFLRLNGFEFVFKVLEKIENEKDFARFIEKASFFICCICQELSEAQLSKFSVNCVHYAH